MTAFMFLLGLLQCFALYFLGKNGDRLSDNCKRQWQQAAAMPPQAWPPCAMIVPLGGVGPNTEAALRSLAEQDYPDYRLFIATAEDDEHSCALIQTLERQYGHVAHVTAGQTTGHGQKNHNILAAMAAAGSSVEIYALCDSTHAARADFLRCLLNPIVRGEAAFTTGYHSVEPEDQGIITLAYALNVLFMRFMQALPGLAQPWGGAMAMSRTACEFYHVKELWQSNVVDDCSLGALLTREGVHVRLCPGALLTTRSVRHKLPVWKAWLTRQILFLKFCMPGEWLALSLVCILMTAPPLWCVISCASGILGFGGGTAPFLALCWLCVIGWTIGSWRRFLPGEPAISRWVWAFFCASFMFTVAYLGTFATRTLLWNSIAYKVGKDGHVIAIERKRF